MVVAHARRAVNQENTLGEGARKEASRMMEETGRTKHPVQIMKVWFVMEPSIYGAEYKTINRGSQDIYLLPSAEEDWDILVDRQVRAEGWQVI